MHGILKFYVPSYRRLNGPRIFRDPDLELTVADTIPKPLILKNFAPVETSFGKGAKAGEESDLKKRLRNPGSLKNFDGSVPVTISRVQLNADLETGNALIQEAGTLSHAPHLNRNKFS